MTTNCNKYFVCQRHSSARLKTSRFSGALLINDDELITSIRCDFYVYGLMREDGLTPFYIGKGTGGRAYGLNQPEVLKKKSKTMKTFWDDPEWAKARREEAAARKIARQMDIKYQTEKMLKFQISREKHNAKRRDNRAAKRAKTQ